MPAADRRGHHHPVTGRRLRTPSPTSRTTPTASWPRMVPSTIRPIVPRTKCRSVPQIALVVTSTTASAAAGSSGPVRRPADLTDAVPHHCLHRQATSEIVVEGSRYPRPCRGMPSQIDEEGTVVGHAEVEGASLARHGDGAVGEDVVELLVGGLVAGRSGRGTSGRRPLPGGPSPRHVEVAEQDERAGAGPGPRGRGGAAGPRSSPARTSGASRQRSGFPPGP